MLQKCILNSVNKTHLAIALTILVLLVVSYNLNNSSKQSSISSFEECAAAGNPIMESYPARCNANGKTFTEDIGNELEKSDLIQVENPRPNTVITSPLLVAGRARGTWYFEADFPIYLYDAQGKEIARAIAQAQGELMTEEFVPFETTLTFSVPETKTGELVLERSNPSGLPENTDELRIPVQFSEDSK